MVAGVMTPALDLERGHAPEVWEHEGMHISLTFEAAERGPIARLKVTDAESGEPVRGLTPRAWLDGPGEDGPLKGAACGARVQELKEGGLAERAEVDLNGLRVMLLNDDHTLSVVNPQIALKQTRLEALLRLPGEVADWVLHPDGRSLYLSIPELKQVLVVETQGFGVASTLALEEAPGALAVSPDGRHLWVGGAGAEASALRVIDTYDDRVVEEVEVGPGPHQVVFSHGGHRVWVAGERLRELVAIDGPSKRRVGAVAVGKGVVSLVRGGDYLAVARRDGEVRLFDVQRGSVARVPLAAGVARLDVAPGGRWAFAMQPGLKQVSVIDLARATSPGAFRGIEAPEEVVFTKNFAYIESAAGAQPGMVALDALAGREPSLQWVSTRGVGMARGGGAGLSAVPGPDGRSLFVASPGQRAIMVLGEGQHGLLGRIDNRVGTPRALMLLDRSLKEEAPGVYSTAAALDLASPRALRLDLGGGIGAFCF
ncbi:YncE family protein [Bradymonadaceae bacterium TMQ3]|nr:YncE family protein [Bradymonadaceae bacterium TMQ3]